MLRNQTLTSVGTPSRDLQTAKAKTPRRGLISIDANNKNSTPQPHGISLSVKKFAKPEKPSILVFEDDHEPKEDTSTSVDATSQPSSQCGDRNEEATVDELLQLEDLSLNALIEKHSKEDCSFEPWEHYPPAECFPNENDVSECILSSELAEEVDIVLEDESEDYDFEELLWSESPTLHELMNKYMEIETKESIQEDGPPEFFPEDDLSEELYRCRLVDEEDLILIDDSSEVRDYGLFGGPLQLLHPEYLSSWRPDLELEDDYIRQNRDLYEELELELPSFC